MTEKNILDISLRDYILITDSSCDINNLKINSVNEFTEYIIHKNKGTGFVGVGVGGLLIRDNSEVLLYKRPNSPDKGLWSMPGGGVRFKQTIHHTIVEEFKNIVGMKIDEFTLKLLRITNHNQANDGEYHFLSPAFLIQYNDEDRTSYSHQQIFDQDRFTKKFEKRKGKGEYELRWWSISDVLSERIDFSQPTLLALDSYQNSEYPDSIVLNDLIETFAKDILNSVQLEYE